MKPKVNCRFSIANVFVFEVSVATFSAKFCFFSLFPQENSTTATGKIQIDFLISDFISF
jgi:hypothetical protein